MECDLPEEYRSAEPYYFRKDDADKIVRTISYHREDFCRARIWFSKQELKGIRQWLAPTGRPTRAWSSDTSLGGFSILPPELRCDMLLGFDMKSLFKMRETSLGWRDTIDSFPPYRRAVTAGLTAICALLRTGLASKITLSEFDNALCTESCAFCGRFAGFIFLPTWKRACFDCLERAPETQVRTVAALHKEFQLTVADERKLMSFRTLRRKTKNPHFVPKRSECQCEVASAQQARDLAMAHASNLELESSQQPQQPEPQTKSEKQPEPEPQTDSEPQAESEPQADSTPRTTVTTRVFRKGPKEYEKFRYMASCALPYYDRRTHRVNSGLQCMGCQTWHDAASIVYLATGDKEIWDWTARTVYTAHTHEGLLEHFKWCQKAQDLWEESEKGMKQFNPVRLNRRVKWVWKTYSQQAGRPECGCILPWNEEPAKKHKVIDVMIKNLFISDRLVDSDV